MKISGSPLDIAEETKHIIRDAACGGGLILGSSNSIVLETKFENFIAMIETANRYGKYPRFCRFEVDYRLTRNF